MNSIPAKEQIAALRKKYPVGTHVILVRMNDPYADVAPGTLGRMEHIDDCGTIHCFWKNGSRLGVVFGVDEVRKADAK